MKLKTLANNQTIVELPNGIELFFSYQTPVAGRDAHGYFKTSRYYSRTTTRHINAYLDGRNAREMSQETIDGISINKL